MASEGAGLMSRDAQHRQWHGRSTLYAATQAGLV
jgi:hypothetical protein